MTQYLETYTNIHGEQWWFDYNSDNDMGVLWGDDFLISGRIFYIFNGPCPNLILNNEEKAWLTESWNKHSLNKSIYLNLDTEYQIHKHYVCLTNNYCPICLKEKTQFENHHCFASADGGSDDNVNMLRICNSCHSLLTRGCEEDMLVRHLAAIYHQLYIFGIDFYKMNPSNNKRYGCDRGLYINKPYVKEVLDQYEKLNENEKIDFNTRNKEFALYKYKYYRSIVMGFFEEENPDEKYIGQTD